MKTPKISEAVVKRLPIYLRFLTDLYQQNGLTVSSSDLGQKLNMNPAQIRKDLACFGEFGKKGIGYDVPYLIENIKHILNLQHKMPIVLIGAGNLGRALCNYQVYFQDQMNLCAVFDSSDEKVGEQINHLQVEPISKMKAIISEHKVRMAIIAVPAIAAQNVANLLVDSGIRGILNFAPTILHVPDSIRVHYVDFTTELQSLAFYLQTNLSGGEQFD